MPSTPAGRDINASANSSCAQPPSPPSGLLRAFARLVSSVGGVSANFALPRARAFANPEPTPNFSHARGFLSKYNYTEYFTVKTSRLAHSGQYDTIITRKNLNEIKKRVNVENKNR